jgi:hypothetical protein
MRVTMQYSMTTGVIGGNRFYLGYTSSPPALADLTALATNVQGSWNTHIAPLIPTDLSLTTVICQDLSTKATAPGTWTGTVAGSRTGVSTSLNNCAIIRFTIARNYRGGHPRLMLPGGVITDLASSRAWTGTYASAVQSGFAAFVTALEGTQGSIGGVSHVSVPFFKSHQTNTDTSIWAPKVEPIYNTNIKPDTVTAYFVPTKIGQMKRRLTSTT